MQTKSENSPEIWATLSGKGGTGETFILSQMARELVARGHRVIAIDYPGGAPNLHHFFDITDVEHTISHFFVGRRDLSEIIQPTAIKNLGLIAGDFLSLIPPPVRLSDHRRFLKALKALPCDYILMDLGCQPEPGPLDLCSKVDRLVAITIPETIAVQNLFTLLKSLQTREISHRIKRSRPDIRMEKVWRNRHDLGINTVNELIVHLSQISGDDAIMKRGPFSLDLILNKVRTPIEINQGFSIRSVAMKYLNVDLRFIGYVEYDNLFWKGFSLIEKKRISVSSRIQQEISLTVQNLIEGKQLKIDKTKNV